MKKSIISFLSLVSGVAIGIFGTRKMLYEKIKQDEKISDKYQTLFLMMDQWVKVKQEGKTLASYFEQHEYQEIAIYGMSYVGRTLADELKNSKVKIRYGIDQNPDIKYKEIEIFSPEEELEYVDAIVVTSITFFSEIAEQLNRKMTCPIISLEDILYER